MDLQFTPIRLELYLFVEWVYPKEIIYNKTIWEYKAPTITKNIFTKHKKADDPTPPNIEPLTINERRRRSGNKGCHVQQVLNRPYYDPAFILELHASDEVSETKLFYAIGSHKGGTDLQDWTVMGGCFLMVPAKLPGGIPIYWSIKANNSQGRYEIVQCFLNTYDSTLPDGRVEHAYQISSHPSKLVGSVVAFEDSTLKQYHRTAVGYNPGRFGSQVIGWKSLRLDQSSPRTGVSGQLKFFTHPKDGKLVAHVLKTTADVSTAEQCAELCVSYGFNCISFDYEHHTQTCDLHDVVAGANAYLRISGTYSNYERLGIGYNTAIEYDDLPLEHGAQYFLNAQVNNVLGYQAYLIGEGTLVDFTPPEPGLIRNNRSDTLRADGCTAAVTQRCEEVTWKENHRLLPLGVNET